MHLRLRLLLIVLCALLLTACGGKQTGSRSGRLPGASVQLEDLRRFPQNLEVYAKAAGQDKPILTQEEQLAQAARFRRILFGPWDMPKTSIRKRDAAAAFGRARGYRHDAVRWTQPEWDAMKANANLKTFPARNQAAITIRDTDLRELPTRERRFSEPTPDQHANPFDYFQYSLLPVGTPVLIAHTSRDGRWHYVECPVAGGWVAAEDLAPVSEELQQTYRNSALAALTRDKVKLASPAGSVTAGVGALLPLGGTAQGGLQVLLPVRGADGWATLAPVVLSAADAAAWPLRMTPRNAARVGNVLMGQPYGWGGMFGDRDCSALTRELLTPFGIWLPRNSAAQARTGVVVPLEGLSAREKEERILQAGVPFLSLVGMRGHITLYVGKYKGRAAIFHNVWGVRTVEGADDNARHVIGKAVVTSITPGAELKNLYRPVTFVDRLRTLSTPADALR
ncbi:SH3 domain-containing C40 family peptidase [uncultured Desulfovibrio sp.]|uniref:C40 family peptidase n=1 Tax=uncultured Desulfovibrio sp. TaxID=167968 RepID=UPI0026220CCD|nr:SH3 domain-containing C40 family peptidase [uncultured Desulfovibrio sp.]